MKKLLLFGFLVLAQVSGHATITIAVGAENLKDGAGTLMGLNGLVVLVASRDDALFGSPTASAFASGDDFEVARWNLTGSGTPGQLNDLTFQTLSGNWGAGDPLKIYWFPTLTLADLTPGANTPYGEYRDPTAAGAPNSGRDSSDPWFTPSDGNTVNLIFETTDAAGTINPPESGNASLTVVPEPSAYAAVFGVACLIGAVASRRFSKSQARS